MFTCQVCGTTTKPRQPINVVITDKRPQTYKRFFWQDDNDRRPPRWEMVEGWEIVKERHVCPTCYKDLTGLAPKMVEERTVVLIEKPKQRPRDQFHKIKIDKTDPNWKKKQELSEIRRRESKSIDPRPPIERKKPVVEFVQRVPNKHGHSAKPTT